MKDKIYDEVVEFLIHDGVDISLKIYSEESYEQKVTLGVPFLENIEKHGELLWTQR